jgi:hypothetical protein
MTFVRTSDPSGGRGVENSGRPVDDVRMRQATMGDSPLVSHSHSIADGARVNTLAGMLYDARHAAGFNAQGHS